MEASKQPGSNGHSGRSSYVSSDVPEFESSTLFDQPQVNSFDVLSILRPSCALKDAVEALETRLEARALFESPQHLKDLPLPDEIKAFIRVLKNPKTGGVVYLLGTLHFSKASVDDGRMLIEAVQPDVVALELDEEGLSRLKNNSLTSTEQYPKTIWQVLKFKRKSFVVLSFPTLWCRYLPLFAAQALGVKFGSDLTSAIDTARLLNVPLELMLKNVPWIVDPTVAINGNDLQHWAWENLIEPAAEVNNGFGRQEAVLRPSDDAAGAKAAFGRAFEAFRRGRPVPLADVAAFRPCASKMVELLRHEGLQDDLPVKNGDFAIPDRDQIHMDLKDEYMGLRLAQMASQHKRVVAVVGSRHVPGVRYRFAEHTLKRHLSLEGMERHRLSEEAIDHEAKRYIEAVRNITRRRMRAVDNINLGMYVGMGALAVGLGAHAKQTPQVAMKVGKIFGKIILVGGIAQVGCAAITAQWAKFGAYLDSAKVLRLVAAQIMFDVYLSTWIQLASSAHLRP